MAEWFCFLDFYDDVAALWQEPSTNGKSAPYYSTVSIFPCISVACRWGKDEQIEKTGLLLSLMTEKWYQYLTRSWHHHTRQSEGPVDHWNIITMHAIGNIELWSSAGSTVVTVKPSWTRNIKEIGKLCEKKSEGFVSIWRDTSPLWFPQIRFTQQFWSIYFVTTWMRILY